MPDIASRLSQYIKQALQEIQNYAILSASTLQALVQRPFYARDILQQLEAIGVGSLTIVLLTGVFTGGVLALNAAATLETFGMRAYIGRLVSLSMVRELGPVLTSLMVTGRVGSGMAAELGSMVVTQQIDALRALGTDPVKKLVVPRLISGLLMVPTLTIVSDFVGILGGWIISTWQLKVSSGLYWRSVFEVMVPADIFLGLVKPFVFGYIVVTVGCYIGLGTTGGTQGVGRSTTQAVVASSVLILAADFFLSKFLLFLLY